MGCPNGLPLKGTAPKWTTLKWTSPIPNKYYLTTTTSIIIGTLSLSLYLPHQALRCQGKLGFLKIKKKF